MVVGEGSMVSERIGCRSSAFWLRVELVELVELVLTIFMYLAPATSSRTVRKNSTNSTAPLTGRHSICWRFRGSGAGEAEPALDAALVLTDEFAQAAGVDVAAMLGDVLDRGPQRPVFLAVRLQRDACGTVCALSANTACQCSSARSCSRTGSRVSMRWRVTQGSAMPSHSSGSRHHLAHCSKRPKRGTSCFGAPAAR